jgi:NAD(P)-dependent dehydrogenase (short-subunit alcohol dehydrogenase family)
VPIPFRNLPDQTGKVHIVTGGYAGCGRELSNILYQRNATVYVAGRSKSKAETAISEIKQANPNSKGRIEFLQVDLADLPTIKPGVEDFLKKEKRLDVLTLNAGVMNPPKGSVTAQNYELQIGTNCLGHFLFAKLLTPLLKQTAEQPDTEPGSVRVTWGASSGVEFSPKGGVIIDKDGNYQDPGRVELSYMASKVGDVFMCAEFARRNPLKDGRGVVTNAWNPGNLKSELQRHTPWWQYILIIWMLYPMVYGAYTELFAGWSEEAGKPEKNGAYIIPWGRFGGFREDLTAEIEKEGGNAEKFWDWCDRVTKEYC